MQKAGADLEALEGIGNIPQEGIAIAWLQRGSSSHEGVELLIGERERRHSL
jgi:hypothetical protein